MKWFFGLFGYVKRDAELAEKLVQIERLQNELATAVQERELLALMWQTQVKRVELELESMGHDRRLKATG